MLLMATLSANYGRIEGQFPNEDLLGSTRRVLNLTEAWLLSVVSEEDWEKHYKEVLTTDPNERQRLIEQRERWGEPDEEGKGDFQLVRGADPAPTSSGFNFKPAG